MLTGPKRTRHGNVVRDLNSVPPLTAGAIVVGFALLTMIVLSLAESVFGGGDDNGAVKQRTTAQRSAAKPHVPKVIDLSGTPYPKTPSKPTPQPSTTAPGGPNQPAGPAPIPLRRLVGEKLLVRMNGTTPSESLLRRVRKGQVGGVVLFAPNVGTKDAMRSLTQRLQTASRAGGGSGVIVAVDQEGGIVKRLQAGPPNRSAPQIGATGSTTVARSEGAGTGDYLKSLGINVDLAPVEDVPSNANAFIANRAFGTNPASVAALSTAFATGLQDAGVAATAKHFPGLGAATTNTDNGRSVIGAPRSVLDAGLKPFRNSIQAGVGMVMMSTATYPAYDASGPAAFSKSIVTGRLRGGLGFQGVVVTDDLDTPAVRSYGAPADGALRSVEAGVDMVIMVGSESSSRAGYKRLLAAAKGGTLTRASLEQSHRRIEALKAQLEP